MKLLLQDKKLIKYYIKKLYLFTIKTNKMDYTDYVYCIVPEVNDICNNDSYNHFSSVVVRKDIYVYYFRDIILKYLKTETYNIYILLDYVQKIIQFLTEEIKDFDKNMILYPKLSLNKYQELLDSYTEYYKKIDIN